MTRSEIGEPSSSPWVLLATPAAAGGAPDADSPTRTYCTPCHGLAGNGRGINVAGMAVRPHRHAQRWRRAATRTCSARSFGGPVGRSALAAAVARCSTMSRSGARHLSSPSCHLHDGSGPPGSPQPAAPPAPGRNAWSRAGLEMLMAPAAADERCGCTGCDGGETRRRAATKTSRRRRRRASGALPERGVARDRDLRRGARARGRLDSQGVGVQRQVRVLSDPRRVTSSRSAFVNLSSMENTIHWHGMHQQGTWQNDGDAAVTQQPVPLAVHLRLHRHAARHALVPLPRQRRRARRGARYWDC